MDELISRQAVIEIVENNHAHDITLCGDAYSEGYRDGIRIKQSDILEDLAELPTVETKIIRCKDCKHHWTHKCMDSFPIERCDLEQTIYDAEVDYCSLAERREVTT